VPAYAFDSISICTTFVELLGGGSEETGGTHRFESPLIERGIFAIDFRLELLGFLLAVGLRPGGRS